jgi:hypothetical protein
MTSDSLVTSLPNASLSESALQKIDAADGVRRAISVTWNVQTGADSEQQVTDDIIIITDDHVRYLSRTVDGWTVERGEAYADDQEFEHVMDDVHDYAVDHSEEKMIGDLFE